MQGGMTGGPTRGELRGDICDVSGIMVGHATREAALTGVTALLCPGGATVGVDVRGSAPAARETDLCRPGSLVERCHAVLLCGGSAFGLAAATGAMQWLEERGIGFQTRYGPVPIVPAAALFDLGLGDSRVRPDAQMGYEACAAAINGPVAQGNVGAGTGCSAGHLNGTRWAAKTGIGSASIRCGEAVVGALVALNPYGDIWEGDRIIAGARDPKTGLYLNMTQALLQAKPVRADLGQSTTLAVIAVGGSLSKEGACKVAQMAHDGMARAIAPIHTMYDGDIVFCLATGGPAVDITAAGHAAALALEQAILKGVKASGDAGELPGWTA